MRQEILVNLGSRSRGANQIALYIRAAEHSSLLALLRCFDALGDDPHIEVSRHIGDGADDGAGFFLSGRPVMKLRSILILLKGKLIR